VRLPVLQAARRGVNEQSVGKGRAKRSRVNVIVYAVAVITATYWS